MSRKKKHPEHVNHERWLISYADFITLLFAFFVVMFAVSQVDSRKVGRFTESFSKAVGIDTFPDPGAGLLPGGQTPMRTNDAAPQVIQLAPELEELKARLVDQKKKNELPSALQVLQRRNELVVRLADSLFFDAGDDKLMTASAKAMRAIAIELKARKVDVRIEGHTDNRPIHTARFRSNWDLSTSRATAVVAVLADMGLEPARLAAAGYGEFHPVATNNSDDGRRQNRRVDIVISVATIPEQAKKVEEPKGEEPKGEEPKGEEPKREEPKREEPKREEPKREEPKREEPKREDSHKKEP